jgi:hypothetical protein
LQTLQRCDNISLIGKQLSFENGHLLRGICVSSNG